MEDSPAYVVEGSPAYVLERLGRHKFFFYSPRFIFFVPFGVVRMFRVMPHSSD